MYPPPQDQASLSANQQASRLRAGDALKSKARQNRYEAQRLLEQSNNLDQLGDFLLSIPLTPGADEALWQLCHGMR